MTEEVEKKRLLNNGAEDKVVKKSLSIKQQNSYQRREQIRTYKSILAREARQRRYESRKRDNTVYEVVLSSPVPSPESSPRKKKRVSFQGEAQERRELESVESEKKDRLLREDDQIVESGR